MSNKWKVKADAQWKKDYVRMFQQTPKRKRTHIAKIKLLKHLAKNEHEATLDRAN